MRVRAACHDKQIALPVDSPLTIGGVSSQQQSAKGPACHSKQQTAADARGVDQHQLAQKAYSFEIKTSSGKNAETMKFGTSTTWLTRKSTATLATTYACSGVKLCWRTM